MKEDARRDEPDMGIARNDKRAVYKEVPRRESSPYQPKPVFLTAPRKLFVNLRMQSLSLDKFTAHVFIGAEQEIPSGAIPLHPSKTSCPKCRHIAAGSSDNARREHAGCAIHAPRHNSYELWSYSNCQSRALRNPEAALRDRVTGRLFSSQTLPKLIALTFINAVRVKCKFYRETAYTAANSYSAYIP